MAGEDLSGHGHDVVDHVDDDSRSGEVEEEPELDSQSGDITLEEWNVGLGQYFFKLTA